MARDRSDEPPGRKPHSITDHALGALAAHIHAPGEDHDHDHDGMDLLPDGKGEHVALTSIGIDVGSSGTQIVFARLTLEAIDVAESAPDPEASHTPTTRRREMLFQSPIYLTPYASESRIDAATLARLVDHAFEGAGLDADAIDCGVVILTGAARERGNAEAIATALAERCGDIVSASAGHHMEARLAAHGSGAVARSAEFGQRFLNVDIGGATTKLAVCEHGKVIAAAALAIGGRLVATDKDDRIVRLERSGREHAHRAGFDWQAGGFAPWPERQAVGRSMAETLVGALTQALEPPLVEALYLTPPLTNLGGIDGVIVSGGVGEYVYGRESRSFGDLGLALGRALARAIDQGRLPWPLLPASECIRATALGASSFSVQLSGRTGCITNPADLLPRRNLPVIGIATGPEPALDADRIAQAITAACVARDIDPAEVASPEPVLAIGWSGEPDHPRLAALAAGVKHGFSERLAAGMPLYVVVDGDIAASLGAILRDELGIRSDLLVLDGLALSDLAYVDLGRIRLPSGTVPVTVKTLEFRDEPRQKASRTSSPRRNKPG